MRLGVGLGIGVSTMLAARYLVASDFASAPAGSFASFQSTLTHARASTANVPTSNGQAYTMGILANAGAIADWYGVRGLLHCRGYTNLLGSKARSLTAWAAASVSPSASSTGGQSGSPDGTSSVVHHVVSSGGAARYPTYSITLGHTYTSWCLARPNGGSLCQINQFDTTNHNAAFTLAAGWNLVYKTLTVNNASTGGFVVADGRNGGNGTIATALDYDTDMHAVGEVPYALPWHATTLAPTSLSTSIDGYGRFRMRVKMTWLCGSAQLTDNPTLWYVDSLNYCEIDRTMRTLRVVVDGYPIRLSLDEAGLDAWVAGDTHEFVLDCGNGVPRGSVSTNGGTLEAFDTVTASHGPLWSEGAPLYLLSRAGTSQHADCIVQALQVTGLSTTPVITKYWTAPGASGDGLTRNTPASLDTALALAVTALAAGSRVRVVVTASGMFRVGAGLTWDASYSGLTLAPLPGVTYSLSGSVDATTGWTVDSGSRYKRAYPGGTSGRLGLTANGTRATIASSAISANGISGWSRTPTGFTAADSTIAGYAHPEEVEVITRGTTATWKQAYLPLTAALATALTCDATDIAAADWQVGYTMDKPVGYRGVKELVAAGTYAAERATSTLYYQPRVGETMNTTEIHVAAAEHVITIDGASNVTVIGATICDTKWDRTTTARSGGAYPYGGGGASGSGYIPLQDGVTGGPNGDYWTIPAAATVRNGSNVWFAGVTFARIGGDALAFETGAKSDGHRGCVFTDISGHAVRCGFVMPIDQRPASESDVVSDIWNWSSSMANCGVDFADCAHVAHFFVRRRRTYYCLSTSSKWTGFSFGWGWSLADNGGSGWPVGYTTAPTTPTINAGGIVEFCKAVNSGTLLVDGGSFYYNGNQGTSSTRKCFATSGGATRGFYLDNGCVGETNTDCTSQASFFAQFGSPVANGNTLINSTSGNATNGYGVNGNTSTGHRIVAVPFVDAVAVETEALAGLA